MQLKKILVPTDFSDDCEHAVQYARDLARERGAELILLHVIEPILIAPGGNLTTPIDHYQIRQAVEERLAKCVPSIEADGLTVHRLLRSGTPDEEIVKAAKEEGADLIVMGTHGHSGLPHLLLGSVAERTVRRSTVPVLTVRRPDRPQE